MSQQYSGVATADVPVNSKYTREVSIGDHTIGIFYPKAIDITGNGDFIPPFLTRLLDGKVV